MKTPDDVFAGLRDFVFELTDCMRRLFSLAITVVVTREDLWRTRLTLSKFLSGEQLLTTLRFLECAINLFASRHHLQIDVKRENSDNSSLIVRLGGKVLVADDRCLESLARALQMALGDLRFAPLSQCSDQYQDGLRLAMFYGGIAKDVVLRVLGHVLPIDGCHFVYKEGGSDCFYIGLIREVVLN